MLIYVSRNRSSSWMPNFSSLIQLRSNGHILRNFKQSRHISTSVHSIPSHVNRAASNYLSPLSTLFLTFLIAGPSQYRSIFQLSRHHRCISKIILFFLKFIINRHSFHLDLGKNLNQSRPDNRVCLAASSFPDLPAVFDYQPRSLWVPRHLVELVKQQSSRVPLFDVDPTSSLIPPVNSFFFLIRLALDQHDQLSPKCVNGPTFFTPLTLISLECKSISPLVQRLSFPRLTSYV